MRTEVGASEGAAVLGGRGFWARLLVGTVVVAPLTAVAVAAPASAAGESETYFSWVSTAGDWIGQGGQGTLTAPTQFSMTGTAGSLRFQADTGTDYWTVALAAPRGQQLSTGVYENAARAGFNDTAPGLAVSTTGRGCNTVKGRFTIYAIGADTAGRITSLDATLTQFCDSTGAGLTATVKYAAPYVIPPVLTSSNPSTVPGEPVTLSARTTPGTAGGVVFYDSGTPIGQAAFDTAGTGRLTTTALAPGSHAITARVGTTTSAVLTQVVAAGDTSLWFASQNGESIGQGATASFVAPTSTVRVSGTSAFATVSVDDPASGQWWSVVVAAPPGEVLRVGTYPGAVRATSRGAGQPGLDVYGSGRGCNTLTGDFAVNGIATNPDGSIASLDVTFNQHCEGGPTTLTGRVRVNAPAVAPRAASTTVLGGGTGSDGAVGLTATVSGGSGTPTGQVTFREGSTTLGTSTVGGDGTAYLLVPGLPRGSHTLTAAYGGDTSYLPSTASTTVVVPGITTTTTMSAAKTAKLGKPVSVTATVTSAAGATPATGQVGLYDGVEPVGTATLVGSKATITWTPSAKGTRSLTVRYLGDPTHAPSVSPAVAVKVT